MVNSKADAPNNVYMCSKHCEKIDSMCTVVWEQRLSTVLLFSTTFE